MGNLEFLYDEDCPILGKLKPPPSDNPSPPSEKSLGANPLGGKAEPLAALTADCATPDQANTGYTVRNWGEVLDAVIPARKFILGDLFACGQVQVLFGQGGLGKSRIATNIARNQVLGLPFLGMSTGPEPMRHLFIGSENDIHRWQIDTRCMSRGLTASDICKLTNNIYMTTLEQAEDCFINLGDQQNVAKWRETLHAWTPDVVWCDPWGDIIEGDGFDRDVRATISTLRKLARAVNPDAGIVIMAHARTGTGNILQAVGFDAANFGKDSKALFSTARAVVNIAPFDTTELPDLCWVPAKNNNGRNPSPFRIRLNPETMTYSDVEPLNVEAWQDSVRAASKERRTGAKTGRSFDADAIIKLGETVMTVTELHTAVMKLGVTKRDTEAGIDRLEREKKLIRVKAKSRNKWFIGSPEAMQKFQQAQE